MVNNKNLIKIAGLLAAVNFHNLAGHLHNEAFYRAYANDVILAYTLK